MDQNLCNVAWYELEIANIQTEMGEISAKSEEYDVLLKKLETLSNKVLDIERLKLERDKLDVSKWHDYNEQKLGKRKMVWDGVKMIFSGAITFLGIGAITHYEQEHTITTKAWNIVSNLFKSKA